MEELKNAFYEAMYKYELSFGEKGVKSNLRAWAKNKAGLLALLRRHPDWNEDEKAIIFRFNEGRNINQDVVNESAFSMLSIADELLTGDQHSHFTAAFEAAISEYSNTLSEESLNIIRENSNVKCVTGQKTSRIIGRLCREFHLDTHKQYNSAFAQLADALNPLSIEKTALLSVHPCDFLEMSNIDNPWHSCHCLADGSYKSGCLSYMCDTVTMIFYTVDNEVTHRFYRYPKLTRELFHYKENMLFQSRLYPQNYYEPMDQYRALVQKAIAICLGVPNLWALKEKRQDISRCYYTGDNCLHYPDYEYHGNLSLLKDTEIHSVMDIGSPSRCLCCGNTCDDHSSLKCNCESTVICRECGETVSRSTAKYMDEAFYCNSCLNVCSVCGEITHGIVFPAMDRHGVLTKVCHECYSAALEHCGNCRIRTLCSLLGCNVLCRKSKIFIQEDAAA